VLAAPALLLAPRIDAAFGATMPRKALAEAILLLFLGWALSRLTPHWRKPSYAPAAVTGATLGLMFWMIPRSIDQTQISFVMNGLYVYSLLVAGFLLSHFWPLLSGVVKVATALYASSMIVGIGLLYASLSTLLCSAFTLEDQHAFGRMIVALGLFLYVLALASMMRWLKAPVAGATGE